MNNKTSRLLVVAGILLFGAVACLVWPVRAQPATEEQYRKDKQIERGLAGRQKGLKEKSGQVKDLSKIAEELEKLNAELHKQQQALEEQRRLLEKKARELQRELAIQNLDKGPIEVRIGKDKAGTKIIVIRPGAQFPPPATTVGPMPPFMPGGHPRPDLGRRLQELESNLVNALHEIQNIRRELGQAGKPGMPGNPMPFPGRAPINGPPPGFTPGGPPGGGPMPPAPTDPGR